MQLPRATRLVVRIAGNPFTVIWADSGTNTGKAFDVRYKVGSGAWQLLTTTGVNVTSLLDSSLSATKTIHRDSNNNTDYEEQTAWGSSTVVSKKSYTYTSYSLGGSSPYYSRYLPAS